MASLSLHERPPEVSKRTTFASLMIQISVDESLAPLRRRDLISALRTAARAFGLDPEHITADPAELRQRLTGFAPAIAGLSNARWRNVISLVRAAFKHAGLIRLPARSRTPLTPEWGELFRRLPDRRSRCGLSRFARYCSARSLAPDHVNDLVLEAFLRDLEEGSLVKNPRSIHRTASVTWNRAASAIPAWPRQHLSVVDRRRRFALPWGTFPLSLTLDINNYLERLAGKDLLAEDSVRPLRPTSIENRRKLLRAFVSALVHQGHDPQSLLSLRDVVPVEVIKSGLQLFLERADNKVTAYIHEVAHVLTSVARYWVRVDHRHLQQLETICRRLRRPDRGIMSAKTRSRLRPFADPATVQTLLAVPDKLLAQSKKKGKSRRGVALDVQTALAIEFLLMVPIRIGNLANIHVERQLIRHRKGTMHLVISGEDTKNGMPVEAVLPTHLARMIDSYLLNHRNVLAAAPSPWLFPGDNAKPIGTQALAKRISKALKHHTGVHVNPHLFRAIAATLYLEHNPGAYGLIRLLLGHKSIDTTTRYYCGTEATAAMRHYHEHVLKLRMAEEPRTAAGRTN